MNLGNALMQYQFGQQQAALMASSGYNHRPEPVEVTLAQKKAATEQAIAAHKESLSNINAAIDAINEHPNVAKVILVPGLGEVVAIRSEGGPLGERYYFLIDKHGTVSFMPSETVEAMR